MTQQQKQQQQRNATGKKAKEGGQQQGSGRHLLLFRPSTAWCLVWWPTLFYFLYTRYPSITQHQQQAMADRFQIYHDKDCSIVTQSVWYSQTACPTGSTSTASSSSGTRLVLRHGLQLLWNADDSEFKQQQQQPKQQEQTLTNIPPPHDEEQPMILLTHSAWYHDTETGRGAILIAQGSGDGRVWRWETGGGPIPIGRTLVLDQAGCRSVVSCHERQRQQPFRMRGVGAVARLLEENDNNNNPLILAEWGEGRIIRLETETGARTPLVMNVPVLETCGGGSSSSESAATSWQRIQAPTHMQVTATGTATTKNTDLFFLDHTATSSSSMTMNDNCHVIWQRYGIDKIPALPSLAVSRKAHAWTTITGNDNDDDASQFRAIFSNSEPIGGFVVVPHNVMSSKMLVSTSLPTVGVVILEIPLDDDDNEEEKEEGSTSKEPRIIFRLQRYLPTALQPGPLVVTPKQGNIFLATNEGLALLLPNHGTGEYRFAGLLHLPIMDRPRITSLTLGQDSYLYVTTESRLWRIKIKD